MSPAPNAANQNEKHIFPDSLALIVGEIIFTRFDLGKNIGSFGGILENDRAIVTCSQCWRCRSMRNQRELHMFYPEDWPVSLSGSPSASQSCRPVILGKISNINIDLLENQVQKMVTYSCGVPPSTGVSVKGALALYYQSRFWDRWTNLRKFHRFVRAK